MVTGALAVAELPLAPAATVGDALAPLTCAEPVDPLDVLPPPT
jgi:hypothetical protein